MDFSLFKTLKIDGQSVKKLVINGTTVFAIDSGGEVKPCFAVIDDITTYTERTYSDVYDNATSKWYKLNNLNEYEEYGVYQKVTSLKVADSKYTQVSYISKLTKTSNYIDTGYKIVSTDCIELQCSFDSQIYGWNCMVGATDSDTTNLFRLRIVPNSTNLRLDVGTGNTTTTNTVGVIDTFTIYSNKWIVNGSTKTLANSVGDSNYNLYLFNENRAGSAMEAAQGKIYYLKIYTDSTKSTLKHCYMPAVDGSGNIGFYDTVDEVFHPANDSSDFSYDSSSANVGVTTYTNKLVNYPTVSSDLPDGYTEKEYISNESGGGHIDLGYTPNDNSRYQIKLNFLSGPGGSFIGDGSSDEDNDYRVFWNSGVGNIYFDCGSGRIYSSFAPASTTDYELEIGNYYIKDLSSGSNLASGTAQTLSRSGTMRLFGGFSGNESDTERIHYFKIYEGDTLVMNLIPCTNSDGSYGFYDVIGGEFYTSSTTGLTGGDLEGTPTEYKWNGSKWVNQGEITTNVDYFIAGSSTIAKFNGGHYWGNGYKMCIDMYIDTSYSSGNAEVLSPVSTSPIEFSLYLNGFYFDWHGPTSTTDNSVDSADAPVRILQTSVSALPKDSTRIRVELTNIAVNIYKYSDNTLLCSYSNSTPTNDWYSGLYYFKAISNAYAKIHSYTVYNADGDMVNNLVYKYQEGSTNQLYLYDEVLGVSYQNESNSSVSYVSQAGGYSYPVEYDNKVAPANNVEYSSLELLKAMECPWVGMVGYVVNGSEKSKYQYTSSGWVLVDE